MNNKHWVSHDMLQPRCSSWIEKKFGVRPWFPGPMRDNSLPEMKNGILHVILFGDFIDQLVDVSNWPKAESGYCIWVLCEASRKAAARILGIDEKFLGVIPRYDLFPHGKEISIPKQDEEFTLVYSGRFVHRKSFDIFLRVASALQTDFGLSQMKVFAAGFYPSEDSLLPAQFSYLILKLKWAIEPVLKINLKPHEWMSAAGHNPVLVNFSLHRREDFGVSVAQAQEAGWPMILSDWGGHRDVKGHNVIKISVDDFPKTTGSVKEEVDVRAICESILKQWKGSTNDSGPCALISPEVLNAEQLVQMRLPKWSEIRASSFDEYLDSHKSELELYHSLFSGKL